MASSRRVPGSCRLSKLLLSLLTTKVAFPKITDLSNAEILPASGAELNGAFANLPLTRPAYASSSKDHSNPLSYQTELCPKVQIRADDEEKNLAQSIYVSFSEEAEPTLVASYSFPDGSQQFIDNSEIPTSSFTQSEANWFYSPPEGSDQSRPLYVLCEYSPISNKTWQEDDQGFQNKLITYDWLNKYFEKCSQNDQYSDRCQMRHQQWFVRLPDEVDPTSANTQNTEEDSSTEAADVYGDETDLDLDQGPRSGLKKNLQEDICDSNFKSNYRGVRDKMLTLRLGVIIILRP